MKILVTGATGRIGHCLVDVLLKRGDQVRAFVMPADPHRSRVEQPGVEIVEGLLTDRPSLAPAVKGVDAVIHLAALLPSGRTAEELFEVNIRGTFNLLEALLPHADHIRRFVLASTDNVYPDNQGLRYLPVDEAHPRLSNNPYGLSKVICEDMCLSYMRRCGLPVTIPRFGLTLAGQELFDPNGFRAPFYVLKPFLARLRQTPTPDPIDLEAIRQLEAEDSEGVKLVVARNPQGRVNVDMINDPRNVADGLPLLLDKEVAVGDVFNLMAPHPFAYDTFTQYVSKLTGWPVIEVTVSWTFHHDFSIAKARTMLGYNPTRDIFQMLDDGWNILKPRLM
ncbi:MAG: NAD(P)-dependent oxidoreductase [Chloroflexi bacterium]|nr:NAD(P)-dependent oxidoreductase [Chloroflexota bacterium]